MISRAMGPDPFPIIAAPSPVGKRQASRLKETVDSKKKRRNTQADGWASPPELLEIWRISPIAMGEEGLCPPLRHL